MSGLAGGTVVITGAGSGIGRQIAFAFAERGATLELLDVDARGLAITERIASGFGAAVHTHIADVSDASAIARVADRVHARTEAVDVLVNNAGIGAAGRFLDASLETWREVLDVNVLGVVHGCRAFLPRMVTCGRGHVVNVASAAGLAAPADLPVYAASKYAVVGLSESLRADLAPSGIGVSCICPGLIDTPIVERTRYEGAAFAPGVQERIARLYRRRAYPPRRVADAVVRAVETDAGIVPVSIESWAMWAAQRISPGALARLGRLVTGGA